MAAEQAQWDGTEGRVFAVLSEPGSDETPNGAARRQHRRFVGDGHHRTPVTVVDRKPERSSTPCRPCCLWS